MATRSPGQVRTNVIGCAATSGVSVAPATMRFMERTTADRDVAIADAPNRRIDRGHLDLLTPLIDVDRLEVWRDDGARDLAHWVSMRYGLST